VSGLRASRPVLLYDAECRFCRFTARVVAWLDRRAELAILPFQDEAAAPLLAKLPESERSATWRLARPDGSLTGYGAGGPELLAAMAVTRPVGHLLRHIPDSVLDHVYALAARNRSTLGRFVPDGPAPRRSG
jgi:predicted DCC family thiol-disulfide oxidoreductase YuxK